MRMQTLTLRREGQTAMAMSMNVEIKPRASAAFSGSRGTTAFGMAGLAHALAQDREEVVGIAGRPPLRLGVRALREQRTTSAPRIPTEEELLAMLLPPSRLPCGSGEAMAVDSLPAPRIEPADISVSIYSPELPPSAKPLPLPEPGPLPPAACLQGAPLPTTLTEEKVSSPPADGNNHEQAEWPETAAAARISPDTIIKQPTEQYLAPLSTTASLEPTPANNCMVGSCSFYNEPKVPIRKKSAQW